MPGTAQLSEWRHQLCDLARGIRRRMDVSQNKFSRLVGDDSRTIWNWKKYRFAPTLSKRFRLEQLRILVNEVDVEDRKSPVASNEFNFNRLFEISADLHRWLVGDC